MANLDLYNLFWKRTEQESEFKSYAGTVRSARPFSLDAELAGIVSKLAATDSKRLYNYLQSARLPYPVMWLEADYTSAFAHLLHPPGTWNLHQADPVRVGWLIMEAPPGSEIYTAMRICSLPDPEKGGELTASIFPVVEVFSPTQRIDPGDFASRVSGRLHPEIIDAIDAINANPNILVGPWGALDMIDEGRAFDPDYESVMEDRALKSPLRQTNAVLLEPKMAMMCANPKTPDSDSIYARTLKLLRAGGGDAIGELGFIVTALALLNEVPVKYVPYRPSGSIRAGGGMRPFFTSSIVTIEVPATRRRIRDIREQLLIRGREKIRIARHEVRGHWRHVQKLPHAHPDRWERAIDRTGRPCWRTWIPHHERGDAGVGFVHQTYEATKGRGSLPELQKQKEPAHADA